MIIDRTKFPYTVTIAIENTADEEFLHNFIKQVVTILKPNMPIRNFLDGLDRVLGGWTSVSLPIPRSTE